MQFTLQMSKGYATEIIAINVSGYLVDYVICFHGLYILFYYVYNVPCDIYNKIYDFCFRQMHCDG